MISQTHPVNWYVVDFSRDEMTDGMRLSQECRRSSAQFSRSRRIGRRSLGIGKLVKSCGIT